MRIIWFLVCRKHKRTFDLGKSVAGGDSTSEWAYNSYKPIWKNILTSATINARVQLKKFSLRHSDCRLSCSVDSRELPWREENGWEIMTWRSTGKKKFEWHVDKSGASTAADYRTKSRTDICVTPSRMSAY